MLNMNLFYNMCGAIIQNGLCTLNEGFLTIYQHDQMRLEICNLVGSQSMQISIDEGDPSYTSIKFVALQEPTKAGNIAIFDIYKHVYNPCRFTFYDDENVFEYRFNVFNTSW
jgi:hypothetical protein